MRNEMVFRGLRTTAFAAVMLMSAPLFAGSLIPIAPSAGGDGGAMIGPVDENDAERDWANTGTDYNTAANWVQNAVPGTGDVAYFTGSPTAQPNLSASLTNAGIFFSSTTSSGWDLTATAGAALTLNGTNTSGSSPTSTSSAAAIRNNATSGTNTIDAPLVLASASGISTFFNTAGSTLVINGAISETGGAKTLSLKNGTIQLNGNNSFSGGASIDAASTTLVIGNDNALGTGTFSINSTATIQAGGGARTLANNVVFGGQTTLSGSNAFTFNGTATSSGSSSRTLTVSNTGGAIFNGTVNLEESGAPAGRIFTINGTSAVTINGIIQDGSAQPAMLKYTGSNTLTLNGANTYSGGTQETIAGSTIVVGPSGKLGTGNVSLTAGNVTLTLLGATNMASTASLSFVNTDTINLGYGGSMTIASLVVDGVTEAPGTYGQNFNNPDAAFFGEGTLIVTVPEPATWGMMLLGGGLLTAVRRFRRKQI